jgi:hypothetical protein
MFQLPRIRPLVPQRPFQGRHVILPHLLDPVQRAPPRAKRQVVQGRDGLKVRVIVGRRGKAC